MELATSNSVSTNVTELNFCGNSVFWNMTALTDNWYPEFTRCFQHTALTFIPCVWLWLTGIIHLLYLRQNRQYVVLPATWLSSLRLLVVLLLCCVSLGHMLVPLGSQGQEEYPPSFYLSLSVWAATFLAALILMIVSQKKGVASPCVIFLFWTFTLVANIVPVYVLTAQRRFDHDLAHFCLVCVTFGLIVLEFGLQCVGDSKVYLLEPTHNGKPCPMIKASFLSRLTFSWVFRLVYTGYKKVVVLSDIFDLPFNMQCQSIVPDFLSAWTKELHKKKQQKNRNLKTKNAIEYRKGHLSVTVPTEKTHLLQKKTKSISVSEKSELSWKPSLYKVLILVFYLPLFKSQIVGLVGDLLVFLNPVLLE